MEVSQDAMDRMESKLDKLAEAIGHLVLVEERQLMHSARIAKIETLVEKSEEELVKVEQWINRGIGVWGLAAVIFAAVQMYIRGH